MAGGVAKSFSVPGSRGGFYQVVRWVSGAWSCNCSNWIHKRAQSEDHSERTGDHCKHVVECMAGRVKPAGTVYAVAVGDERTRGSRAAAAFTEDAV